ncbi:hypothetical protein L596_030424 [Steinernema carpocapsae]|nr:hypothetical protein L596_030424 [Steinernema carpocapsae]
MGPPSRFLLWTQVPFASEQFCQEKYAAAKTGNLLCTGKDMKGVNMGDSGGPLFVNHGGLWAQVGVSSNTFVTNEKTEWPDAFTRTSKFCDFITNATARSFHCWRLSNKQ